MKPGKSGITLELDKFDELVKLILQIKRSIKRYELKDTGVSTTPMELDLPLLNLDKLECINEVATPMELDLPVLDLDKLECIDEVASVELMKEVERKLWLTHYDMLREKLMEVIREKGTGCQTYETNDLGHEFCALVSAEEQVNL